MYAYNKKKSDSQKSTFAFMGGSYGSGLGRERERETRTLLTNLNFQRKAWGSFIYRFRGYQAVTDSSKIGLLVRVLVVLVIETNV